MDLFPSRPPRRGSGLPYWNWVKLEKGKDFRCYSAGPYVGVIVHWGEGSKPCRAEMTKGALKCYLCSMEAKKIWRAYVPLWDDAGQRRVVLVGFNFAHLLDDIGYLDAVKVTKTSLHGSPIRVEKFNWTTTPPALNDGDKRPQDLKPWLLRMWKDAELEKWLKKHAAKDDGQVLKEHAAKQPTIAEHLRSEAEQLEKGGKLKVNLRDRSLPASLEDVLPYLNGKHSKKGQ